MTTESRRITELREAEYNPRATTREEDEQIRRSLLSFGFVGTVVVNRHPSRKDIIVGGHQRVRIWGELGNRTVPCTYVDLPEDRERELNILLNKAQGHFDFEKLTDFFEPEFLSDMGFENIDLSSDYQEFQREADNEDKPGVPGRLARVIDTGAGSSDRTKQHRKDTVEITVGTITGRIPKDTYRTWLLQQGINPSDDNALGSVLALLQLPAKTE